MVDAAIRDGAVATIGGKRVDDGRPGFYYPPTVLKHATPQMSCGRQEIFGPVAPVIRYAVTFVVDPACGLETRRGHRVESCPMMLP
uniref:Aldedh domain-containing protein n=1 Tax=Mesocestoides corti TaxID=53468 RepID=A0A5K3FYE9_MESCO